MKSRLLAGAAAAVLAIVGAILVITYAQGADQRAVKNLEPVDVLVVKKEIPAGTPAESMAASLVTERLPASAVTGSSLKSLDSSSGKVAAVDLVPGEQVIAERLVAPEDVKTRRLCQDSRWATGSFLSARARPGCWRTTGSR
jgi:pilus assembly protein CpaB